MPRVTVLMSVYNGEKYLSEAVESILRQTYREFEFLIIDDCSKDASVEILDRYSQNDPRIRLLKNNQNRGLGYSLNRGILEASGKWIARMDADDISLPERLERQMRYIDDHRDVDIVGTWAVDIDGNGNVLRERKVPITHEEIRHILPFANPVVHPTVIFRKEAILSVGSYDEKLRKLQDYDLWFRCMAGGLRFTNLPEAMLKYRTDNSYHSKKSWSYRRIDFQVRKRGCTLLNCSGKERLGIFIPLVLGLIPSTFSPWFYSFAKKIDPRQRGVNALHS